MIYQIVYQPVSSIIPIHVLQKMFKKIVPLLNHQQPRKNHINGVVCKSALVYE